MDHRVPDPWPWRRGEGEAPPALVAGLRRYPAGELLATLVWRRGIDEPAEAEDFLEPTLARGLRPPSAFPGVEAAAEQLTAILTTDVAVVPEPVAGPLVAAAVLSSWLERIGCPLQPEGGAARRVRVGTRGIAVEDAWAAGDGAVGLAPAALAFYVLAALRAQRRAAGLDPGPDLRGLLDLVALGVLVSGADVRLENRVLAAVGLRAWLEQPRPGLRALAETAAATPRTAAALGLRLRARLDAAAVAGAGGAVLAVLGTSSDGEARALAAAIELEAAAALAPGPPGPAEPVVLDAEASLDRLTPGVLRAMARLEPHGPGNPEPVLLSRDARVDGFRLEGDPFRPRWRLRLRQDGRTRRGLASGLRGEPPAPGTRCTVAYVARQVERGERADVELEVRGLVPAGPEIPHGEN